MARADARGRSAPGSRRARLESRRQRHTERYGRFLRLTFLGSLLPGVGLIAAGKRTLGGIVLGTVAFLGVIAGVIFLFTPPAQLVSYGGDRQMLFYIGCGLVGLAALWLLIALMTHRSLEPGNLTGGKRFLGAFMVILAASTVVAPMAVAARNAFTQRELIGAISGGHEDSQTVPEIEDKADPWENIPRLNVLLLGADTGGGRDAESLGIRPDTQIVASIDTKTGDTTLISLPRNMAWMPFPEDSPLAAYYPYGYIDQGSQDPLNSNSWLNSVYKNIPNLYPDLGISGSDANKWAVEGALGMSIDYYMMVDLDGFAAIVNALGGVTINVEERVPINYGEPDYPACAERAEYIEPGRQTLNGEDALAYARSRCAGDNYTRMGLQQQVLQAIIASAKPEKLLTEYQSLAGAAQRMIKTDIDPDLFPAIIELTLKVQGTPVESINLDHEFFAEYGGTAANPDYDAIHAAIDEALNPTPAPTNTPDGSPTGEPTSGTDSGSGTSDGSDTSDDDTGDTDADEESDGGNEWSSG